MKMTTTTYRLLFKTIDRSREKLEYLRARIACFDRMSEFVGKAMEMRMTHGSMRKHYVKPKMQFDIMTETN